jgi:hypothetical protein
MRHCVGSITTTHGSRNGKGPTDDCATLLPSEVAKNVYFDDGGKHHSKTAAIGEESKF